MRKPYGEFIHASRFILLAFLLPWPPPASAVPTEQPLVRVETELQNWYTMPVDSVAFSPDGRTIASGCVDKTIRVWDAADSNPVRTLAGHTHAGRSVAFSPDGRTIASGSYDNTIRIWNAADGTPVRTITGHWGPVNSVAFSPDGRTIASGSYDNTIRIWNAADGTPVRTLTGHTEYVNSVTFSPDGRTIASSSGDGWIRLWSTGSGRYVQLGTLRDTWIVMDDEGRFFVPPRGREYIRFNVGLNSYPQHSYWDRFYTPDLMQRFLRGEELPPVDRTPLDAHR